MHLPVLGLALICLGACAGPGQSGTLDLRYDQGAEPTYASRAVTDEVSPLSSAEEDAIHRMGSAMAAAERLLQSKETSDDEREALSQSLQGARAALDQYRAARFRKGTRAGTLGMLSVAAAAIVADDATVIGVADDPLLIPLALAAIAVVIQSHEPSVRDELASAWLELGQRLEALSHTISMTSRGNVIHKHLVDEARDRAVRRAAASGSTLTASQVTEAMVCDELERMTRELRRAGNTEDWKKAISTQKGLRCRPSRNSRE